MRILDLRSGSTLVLGLLVSPTLAWSQATPQAVPSAAMAFELSAEVLDASSTQVANGIEVLASDWPTLIIAKYHLQTIFGEAKGTCTASMVGPNVALMAAHCVDPRDADPSGDALAPTLKVGDRELKFKCEMHPAYRMRPLRMLSPRGSEDFALCVLDDEGKPPQLLQTIRFEVVQTDGKLAKGAPVLMIGYGCDHVEIINGRPRGIKADGKLRVGDGVIDRSADSIPNAAAYATIRTRPGIEPALCPGDSGGPLFSGIEAKDPDQRRRVRGVNSSIDADGSDLVSSIATTGTPMFRTWADDWLFRHAAYKPKACGLNVPPGEQLCRN